MIRGRASRRVRRRAIRLAAVFLGLWRIRGGRGVRCHATHRTASSLPLISTTISTTTTTTASMPRTTTASAITTTARTHTSIHIAMTTDMVILMTHTTYIAITRLAHAAHITATLQAAHRGRLAACATTSVRAASVVAHTVGWRLLLLRHLIRWHWVLLSVWVVTTARSCYCTHCCRRRDRLWRVEHGSTRHHRWRNQLRVIVVLLLLLLTVILLLSGCVPGLSRDLRRLRDARVTAGHWRRHCVRRDWHVRRVAWIFKFWKIWD